MTANREQDTFTKQETGANLVISPEVVFNTDNFVLISGNANLPLARSVGEELQRIVRGPITLFEPVTSFADGETRVRIPANLRRKHVVILQPTCPPTVDKNIIELLFMIDAAKRASAGEITVVTPYFGYARQDRKDLPRVPIGAAVVANMIRERGADRIVTMDIHSEQQQGFFDGPWDNLYASYSLLPAIEEEQLDNLVVVSPDAGGTRRAEKYAQALRATGIATVYKKRDLSVENKSQALAVMGDVKGKNVLLVDDVIDTAGTLTHAATLLKEQGAQKVYVAATHGLFSADALAKIANSPIDKVLVTDTIPHRQEVIQHPKIRIVSVAPLLAEAIKRIETGESISQDLIF